MSLGRFVQRDPIGFAAGDNNMYRFVGNGPTGKVDPSGLCELGNVYDSYGRMGEDLERDRLRNLANASDGAAQTQLFMQLFAGRAGVHDLYADHGFPISARPYGGGSTAYRFADGTRYFEPSEPSTGKHLDVVAVFFPPLDAAMAAGDIYRDPLNPWSYATTIPGVPAGASRLGSGASRAGRCAAPSRAVDPKTAANFLDFFRRDRHLINGVNVILDKSGLKHILERHHPNFWNGTTKATQSFFPKNMSVDEIRSGIGEVLKQNAARVGQIGSNGVGQIEGTVNGIRYVLGLNRGRVGQFYPVGP
jgi:hypothetical protein